MIVNAVDANCFKYILYVLWSRRYWKWAGLCFCACGEIPVSSRVKVRFARALQTNSLSIFAPLVCRCVLPRPSFVQQIRARVD